LALLGSRSGTETADVDMDLYAAVTPDYSKSANGFTGTIDKITIELEAMTPAGEDAAKKSWRRKQ
jgi:hypothetical protein